MSQDEREDITVYRVVSHEGQDSAGPAGRAAVHAGGQGGAR